MTGIVQCLAAAGFALLLATATPAQQLPVRFDYLVRADMFNGFEGDEAAFDRAMALCESRLAENPDDAEALVWHGAGLMFRAGRAYVAGGREQATAFSRQAVAEMARAVALDPQNVSVLVPRAASMLGAGTNIADPERARYFIEVAVGDYEKALALQQAGFAGLSSHAKGELIGALAEGWSRLGNIEASRTYLARLVAELPDSKYAAAARARLDDPTDRRPLTCLGCHTGK